MKIADLRSIHRVLCNAPGLSASSNISLDKQLYDGYAEHGALFLRCIDGGFATVFKDEARNVIFAARDWIGEVPLHCIVLGDTAYFANFIEDLRKVPGYTYANVFAINRSEVIELNDQGVLIKKLYYNFNQAKVFKSYKSISEVALYTHDQLMNATKLRMEYAGKDKGRCAVLLSGGIDSMSVAYFVSKLSRSIPAYTLQIGDKESTDVIRARMIASHFGIEHKVLKIAKEKVPSYMERAVLSSEIYHLYNVFCAVGMEFIAEAFSKDHISYVFTGEGGNECFGDYNDWVIKDGATKQSLILQTTDEAFETPAGREAYVWGNLASEKAGRYNVQLGSGLGKHGGSRMYKPMFKKGISLTSPYFDRRLMKVLTNIPTAQLKVIGGKSGFMHEVFKKEVENGSIPSNFFEVDKIRLQDASGDNADSGLTEILLQNGYDQKKVIDIFNHLFKAHIAETPHLKKAELFKTPTPAHAALQTARSEY